MSTLAEQISAAGLADHIITERQVGDVVGGGRARKYGLVNRALKDGSLIRLKRGVYMLGRPYRVDPIHPFAIAQSLMPGSYISFESALSHHGWIPEGVFVTASVSPGRKTVGYETQQSESFRFYPLAIRDYRFMTSIDRTAMGKRIAFVAQPLRALMDLVELRKQHWEGLEWLTDGMRIELAMLRTLKRKDFAALRPVYRHKGVNAFLNALEMAVLPPARSRNSDD